MPITASQFCLFIKKWGPLLVLSLALAIIVIDSTILNVAIATLIKDLKTDIQSIQWVLASYSLVLAAFTITGGRLGDLFGRKRMFILGAIIFAIGSFTASISTNVGTLLIGWSVIEGIGASLMMPATASLLLTEYRERDRAIAFGVWGGIAAAASAFGPILGGYLTTYVSWHWAFRINVVIAAILVIGSFMIVESRDTKEKPTLDILGVILSSVGLTSIVYGIIESSTYGWFYATKTFTILNYSLNFFGLSITPIAVVCGFLILFVFVLWQIYIEKKGNTPLVSMSLFLNNQFVAGILTVIILGLGQSGLLFAVPIFLQTVRGLDAFHTGFGLLPLSLSLLVSAPLCAYLSKFITPKRLVQIGLIFTAVATLYLRESITLQATIMSLAPSLILYGIGMGAMMSQLSNITLSAVDVSKAGEASGVNNTARQIGATLGSAIIGAIFLSLFVSSFSQSITTSQVIPQEIKPMMISEVSNNSANIEFGTSAVQKNIPSQIQSAITSAANNASVHANQISLLYTTLFTLLGFFCTILLPNTKKLERNPEK